MRHRHSPVKQRRGRLEENSAGRVLSAAVSSLCVQMFLTSEHVPHPPHTHPPPFTGVVA